MEPTAKFPEVLPTTFADDMTVRQTRRRFLTICASTVALCACGSGGDSAPASFGDVSAGNVKDLPVGTLSVVSGQPVIIARDSGGLYAMTITCTHQGCDVEPRGSGSSATLYCPCHGSSFNANGGVVAGPANSPLTHFAVDIDAAGNVTIHGGNKVGAGVRTAVA